MRKGQVSIDLLFAVTLMMLTVLNLVYIASSQTTQAESFDTLTKVKVFSVSLRDTVTKVYAVGDGFKVRMEFPIELKSGDSVIIELDNSTDKLEVVANIGGKMYTIYQDIPFSLTKSSKITLTPENRYFWVVGEYDEKEGKLYVTLSP
jgi:hypothetical protein